MIDRDRAEAIIRQLRADLGLADNSPLHLSVWPATIDEVLYYGNADGERIQKCSVPGVLIYVRMPVDIYNVGYLAVNTDVTAANLAQLPTPALRQQARALLGLAEEEVQNG